ncbi:hypothetical protein [Bacteroides sp.]|uniref:hypothetical protein n=1 Tax=Bacteroides sp. TaxID=29523 RepID=UPI002FCC844A
MKRKNMERKIRDAMKKQKTYSKAMDVAIEMAAIPLSQCTQLADELEKVAGIFDNCDGNDPNVQKSYLALKLNEQARKWLRELHLTRDTVEAESEEDNMDILTKKISND